LTVPVHGLVTVRVVEDGEIVDEVSASNVVTLNGLTALAQALMWSGVQDQATILGMTTPIFLTPLYGAVGQGNGTPSNQDTALFSELARTTVTGGGSLQADSQNGAQTVWSFAFGITSQTWTITEAGVFANASPSSGTLVNHAVLPSPVTKNPNAQIQLQISLTLG